MDADKFNFTLERLAGLTCPPDRKQIRYYDLKVGGLAFRVTPSGSRQYVYYRKLPKENESPRKICEITLGKFGDVKLEQARKKAEELNSLVGKGKDPTIERKESLHTLDSLFDAYIEGYAKIHTKTWQSAIYNYKRYCQRWHGRSVKSIKRQDVQLWLHDVGDEFGRYAANRTYNMLRAVFALRKNLISGDNPCIGVDTFKAKSRERFILPGDEFARFAEALNTETNETVRDFIWMCLFTGARKSNVLSMQWQHIDFELMVWRIPETKNGESQTLPLTPNALDVLRRRKQSEMAHPVWVFPSQRRGKKTGSIGHLHSPTKVWAEILKRANITDLRIHDLRRTAGSYMAIQGVSPTIIGKALGHKSPHSTAIYSKLTQDPVRQALQNAQEALANPERLLPQPSAKVIEIKQKRKKPK
jgi:integrase